MPPPNHILEEEPNDRPRDVVHRRRGRDITRTGEDDGEVDVFEERVRVLLGDEVDEGGCDGTNEEEEDEGVVDLAFGELERGSDDSPL
jgi:hypothetical protein